MNDFKNYIHIEWKNWAAALLLVFAWCFTNTAVAANTLKATAGSIGFYYDDDAYTWYAVYGKKIVPLEDSFDNLKVVWHGTVNNYPLVLVKGQQGHQCEMVFRMYWFRGDAKPEVIKNFKMCWAQHIEVIPGYPVTRVIMDGQTHLIDFRDDARSR